MNLALRDVFELTNCVSGSCDLDSALDEFVSRRRRDQFVITSQTDLLARAFTQKLPWPMRAPVSLVSGFSFLVLDFLDPVKKTFASMNMGHHMPLPHSDASERGD